MVYAYSKLRASKAQARIRDRYLEHIYIMKLNELYVFTQEGRRLLKKDSGEGLQHGYETRRSRSYGRTGHMRQNENSLLKQRRQTVTETKHLTQGGTRRILFKQRLQTVNETKHLTQVGTRRTILHSQSMNGNEKEIYSTKN